MQSPHPFATPSGTLTSRLHPVPRFVCLSFCPRNPTPTPPPPPWRQSQLLYWPGMRSIRSSGCRLHFNCENYFSCIGNWFMRWLCFWAKSRIVVIDWLAIQLSTERNKIGLCKQCISRRYSQSRDWVEMSREIWFTTPAKWEKNQEKCIQSRYLQLSRLNAEASGDQIKVHSKGLAINWRIISQFYKFGLHE